MMTADNLTRAGEVLELCRRAGLKIATAESCTGGLIAATLTEIAGSSDVVERGLISYSNEAKIGLLGVAPATIERFGAVSEETARAMAEGALARTPADIAIAVTGIAGPGGATPEKPVGLVHIACSRRGRSTQHERHLFAGERGAVRSASVAASLALIARMAR